MTVIKFISENTVNKLLEDINNREREIDALSRILKRNRAESEKIMNNPKLTREQRKRLNTLERRSVVLSDLAMELINELKGM